MNNKNITVKESDFKSTKPNLKNYGLENINLNDIKTERSKYYEEVHKIKKKKELPCNFWGGILYWTFYYSLCGPIFVISALLYDYALENKIQHLSVGIILTIFMFWFYNQYIKEDSTQYIYPKENIYNNILKYENDLEKYNKWVESQKKEYWLKMDGFTFEKEVASLFKQHGFSVQLTKGGPDGGVDIILRKSGKRIAVQCKAHKNKISEGIARDLYGVIHAYNYDAGILVTLTGASSNTYAFCSGKRIKIFDVNDLVKIQENKYDITKKIMI